MRSRFVLVFLLFLSSLALTGSLPRAWAATPGDLDTSFNGSGVAITSLYQGAEANGVAVQGDGKTVVAGIDDSGTRFQVARYTTNGLLDTTFGPYSNGTISLNLGVGTYAFAGAFAVAIQSDGKLVVAGTQSLPPSYSGKFVLIRFSAAGALDPSFGPYGNGTAKTLIRESARAFALTIQSDGKIVVAGYTVLIPGYTINFALARYTSGGFLDGSFGPYGNGTTRTAIGTSAGANSVALQADGKIVVAGYASVSGVSNFALARYTSTGLLDTSFGSMAEPGTQTTLVGNGPGSYPLDAVTLQSDGKIVIAGNAVASGVPTIGVARYTSLGTLDPSFGPNGNGTLRTLIGTGSYGFAVAIQTNAKIVVAGVATVSGTNSLALARYTPAGALDASFGSSGTQTTTLGSNGGAYSMALQNDGKIVVAGIKDTSYPGLGSHSVLVARYIGDSIVKVTFQTSPASGSISFNGTTYANGQNANYTVAAYSISATPPAGYSFSSWSTSGGISIASATSNPTTATVTSPGTVTAVFTKSVSSIAPTALLAAGIFAVLILALERSRRKTPLLFPSESRRHT